MTAISNKEEKKKGSLCKIGKGLVKQAKPWIQEVRVREAFGEENATPYRNNVNILEERFDKHKVACPDCRGHEFKKELESK